MTLTAVEPDTIDHLDFTPDCGRCSKQPATHQIRFACGCVGTTCQPCIALLEQYLRDCEAWCEGRGLPHWFQCNACQKHITGWPIVEVKPL